jgi:hypothetical protein
MYNNKKGFIQQHNAIILCHIMIILTMFYALAGRFVK